MQENSTIQRVDLRPIQNRNIDILKKDFGLSDAELNRCLFFSLDQDEPWIPPDILEAIARQDGRFRTISSTYDQMIPELKQIVYSGLVVDAQERSYPRSGVATLNERPGGVEIDQHVLAQGRALNASLRAAGFNPFKPGSVITIRRDAPGFSGPPLTGDEKQLHAIEDESVLRRKDLAAIHAEAEKKGLIVGKEMTRYRGWLERHYGVRSAAVLSAGGRASVIESLRKIETSESVMYEIPVDLQEDALIA